MDMAVQPLRRFAPPPAPRFAPMWARRTFILAGTAILTAAGCYEMYSVLKVGGITVLESIILDTRSAPPKNLDPVRSHHT